MIFNRRSEGSEASINSSSKHPTIETLERLFELSLDMLGTASADGYFTQLNPAYERILGWTRDELMAEPIISFLHPDDVKAASQRLTQHSAPGGEPIVLEQRVRTRDGTYRWIQSSVVPEGGVRYFVAKDITERKEIEFALYQKTEELRHQALHDALTDLPNRLLIADRIDQLMARSRRAGTLGAALYIDLDEFKKVNDTFGHEVGDRLLQAVAVRLTAAIREADTVGRMGGDEFVVLIDSADLSQAAEGVANRILETMRHPFEIDGALAPLVVTASIGIATGYRRESEDLLNNADVAMYHAKSTGKNRYEIFRPEMQADIKERNELEFDLRVALEAKQFRLVYQPIYNLDDLEIIGVEALLRWDHPTLGEIQPDVFIPVLESSGQIVDVGRWTLLEACAQMVTWRNRGSELFISVNVSARQLDHDAIVDDVREALEMSGLEPSSLTIEVTETALMRNVDATAKRMAALKAIGVQVAIDDFGTGYSSLAYLQRFPVDCIKIDRTFTEAIARSPESDALISTLVQLGRDLGLKTLAEGVESMSQLDHLRGEHVNEAQGFLFAEAA